jgi:hypothetical protein
LVVKVEVVVEEAVEEEKKAQAYLHLLPLWRLPSHPSFHVPITCC